MSIRAQILLTVMFLFGPLASAKDRPEIESALNRDFAGQTITQKHFECGQQVTYSADGTVSTADIGSWTTCGKIRVSSVKLDDHMIQIRGERVSLGYDQRRGDFGVIKTDRKQSRVEVDITSAAPLDEAAVRTTLAKIFLQGNEHFSDFVPDFWKPFLIQQEIHSGQRPKSDAIPLPKAERVGEYVSPPRVTFSPDPAYDPVAKKISFQGTSVLWMIVDESGKAHDIRITKPIGLGLDDKAVEAVSRWKFDPARGKVSEKPVAVQISVEVNFRLY